MDNLDRLRLIKCISFIDGVMSDLDGVDISAVENKKKSIH